VSESRNTPKRLSTLARLSFRDLAERLDARGADYRLTDMGSDDSSVLLEGEFGASELHGGLSIHTTDAVEQQDSATEVLLPPGVTVSVVLGGEVTGLIDGAPFHHVAGAKGSGNIWSLTRPTPLVRHIRKGGHVRKVNISITPDWFFALADRAGEDNPQLRRFLDTHHSIHDWTPSEACLRHAEEIVAKHETGDVLGRISLELEALFILKEALASLAERPGDAWSGSDTRDATRARTVRRIIDTALTEPLTLESLAAEAGMSVSTLQRVFRSSYGMSAIGYLRQRRLELARKLLNLDGMSIQQTAHAVGYTSAANFATAFRKQYGYPPSQCRD